MRIRTPATLASKFAGGPTRPIKTAAQNGEEILKNLSVANAIPRLAVLGLAMLAAPAANAAVNFAVDTVADLVDDDTSDGVCHTSANSCSLRAAIMQANKLSGPVATTILLPAGIYTLVRPATVTDGDDDGDLNLTTPVSGAPVIAITGAGDTTTIIDANQIDRVLSVATGRTATISGVTLRNGAVPRTSGGGIYNQGTLTLSHSTLSGNAAPMVVVSAIRHAYAQPQHAERKHQ